MFNIYIWYNTWLLLCNVFVCEKHQCECIVDKTPSHFICLHVMWQLTNIRDNNLGIILLNGERGAKREMQDWCDLLARYIGIIHKDMIKAGQCVYMSTKSIGYTCTEGHQTSD